MVHKSWRIGLSIVLAVSIITACESETKQLPILGPTIIKNTVVDGALIADTTFGAIRGFKFWDQDSNVITENTVEGKLYVTDFFFTSCPTICPKMKQQMLRIHDRYLDEDKVVLLSHSIDPVRDSVQRLKTFAEKLGVQTEKWHLMTGNRDSIYSMAKHYVIAAQEDPDAPGGFAHSGAFLLVDTKRQIRGIYDGTDPQEVDQLMDDIQFLNEQE